MGEAAHEPLGDGVDVRLIGLADEDEGGLGDLAQAVARVGHQQLLEVAVRLVARHLQLERPQLHRVGAAAHVGIDILGPAPGPSIQKRTLTSAAASRSPRSIASSSAAQYSWTASDHSCPGSPEPTRTSAETRSGCASATSSATRPPSDVPTSAASVRPAASITAIRSRACEYAPAGIGERPNPRMS